MRVFLDANILFSAADARSITSADLAELIRLGHEVVTNSYAWDETKRNLMRKRPHMLEGLEDLRSMLEIVDTSNPFLNIECAEKDKEILAGAISAGCTHLWTGDKRHFGTFYGKKVHGVLIVPSVSIMFGL